MSDAQTAYEKTLTGLAPALAGASLIYGAGMLESGMTCDLGQMVMDNEAIALIRKFVAGVSVDDETLAVDHDLLRGLHAFEPIDAFGPARGRHVAGLAIRNEQDVGVDNDRSHWALGVCG